MIHPDTELRFINQQIGHGVVATRLIPRGSITWVRDPLDHTLSPAEVEALDPLYRPIIDKYTFVDMRGDYVLCWDLARFVNHSCEASCLAPGYEFEVAVRDIQPGEQLTDDYGALNIDEPFPCHCGSAVCRQQVLPDDLLRHGDRWDLLLRSAFPHVGRVAQPLWSLVREKDSVMRAVGDPGAMSSCRFHRRPGADRAGRAEEQVSGVLARTRSR